MSTGPFTYTNRRGVPYYVHAVKTSQGHTRYTARRSFEGALPELPKGYEIAESVNGRVSVRKASKRVILQLEEQLVEKTLRAHGKEEYRFAIKGRHITIHEPLSDINEMMELAHPAGGFLESALAEAFEKQFGPGVWEEYMQHRKSQTRKTLQMEMQYSPVLRFCLEDPKTRLFAVERMGYRKRGGWLWLMGDSTLGEALGKYIPLLGTEELFEHF